MPTVGEWITILTTVATVGVATGVVLARLAAADARLQGLERGNTDGKRRLGKLEQFGAVVDFKLFGRRPTVGTPSSSEDTPT